MAIVLGAAALFIGTVSITAVTVTKHIVGQDESASVKPSEETKTGSRPSASDTSSAPPRSTTPGTDIGSSRRGSSSI